MSTKTPPPDRSSIVKELEKRLLKKWAEEKSENEDASSIKKPLPVQDLKKKK